MKRIFRKQKGRPIVRLESVSSDEKEAIERALRVFAVSTNQGVDSTVQLLQEDFDRGELSSDCIERISRWSNSDATFRSAVEPARAVVRALLGCLLERLIDADDKRVANYDALVDELGRRISST